MSTSIRSSSIVVLVAATLCWTRAADAQVTAGVDLGPAVINGFPQPPHGQLGQASLSVQQHGEWGIQVSGGRTSWQTGTFRTPMKYLTVGLVRMPQWSAICFGRVRPFGRFGVGRYAFSKSRRNALTWGFYGALGVDVGITMRISVSGELTLHAM